MSDESNLDRGWHCRVCRAHHNIKSVRCCEQDRLRVGVPCDDSCRRVGALKSPADFVNAAERYLFTCVGAPAHALCCRRRASPRGEVKDLAALLAKVANAQEIRCSKCGAEMIFREYGVGASLTCSNYTGVDGYEGHA